MAPHNRTSSLAANNSTQKQLRQARRPDDASILKTTPLERSTPRRMTLLPRILVGLRRLRIKDYRAGCRRNLGACP